MADIGESKINFTFTVNEVNAILNVLGQAPFVQSAALINAIQAQGGPQVAEIQGAAEAEEAAEAAVADVAEPAAAVADVAEPAAAEPAAAEPAAAVADVAE